MSGSEKKSKALIFVTITIRHTTFVDSPRIFTEQFKTRLSLGIDLKNYQKFIN